MSGGEIFYDFADFPHSSQRASPHDKHLYVMMLRDIMEARGENSW